MKPIGRGSITGLLFCFLKTSFRITLRNIRAATVEYLQGIDRLISLNLKLGWDDQAAVAKVNLTREHWPWHQISSLSEWTLSQASIYSPIIVDPPLDLVKIPTLVMSIEIRLEPQRSAQAKEHWCDIGETLEHYSQCIDTMIDVHAVGDRVFWQSKWNVVVFPGLIPRVSSDQVLRENEIAGLEMEVGYGKEESNHQAVKLVEDLQHSYVACP